MPGTHQIASRSGMGPCESYVILRNLVSWLIQQGKLHITVSRGLASHHSSYVSVNWIACSSASPFLTDDGGVIVGGY